MQIMTQKLVLIILFISFSTNLSGQCWQTTYNGGFDNAFTDVYFSSDSVGWVTNGFDNGLYKSNNEGQSWIALENEDIFRAYCVFFLNQNAGWIVNSSRKIFKTIDGGSHGKNICFPQMM